MIYVLVLITIFNEKCCLCKIVVLLPQVDLQSVKKVPLTLGLPKPTLQLSPQHPSQGLNKTLAWSPPIGPIRPQNAPPSDPHCLWYAPCKFFPVLNMPLRPSQPSAPLQALPRL